MLNDTTCKWRKRHLPLYGRLRSYKSICLEAILNSSLIASPFSWLLTTQIPNHQLELSIGTSISKVMPSRQNTPKEAKPIWLLVTSWHIIWRKMKNIGQKICVLPSSKCSSQSHDPGWNTTSYKARQDTPVCVLAHLEPTVAHDKALPTEHQEADQEWITDVQPSERQTDRKRWVRCHSQEQPCYHPICVAWKSDLTSSWRTPGTCEDEAIDERKVWLPGIDQLVKRKLETCLACQANSIDSHPEPLQMSALPDCCGTFPTREYLLMVIDAYSRFPEVDIVRSTSASAIMLKLVWIFATHSIPMILHINNGPPFSSYEIKRYVRVKGIMMPLSHSSRMMDHCCCAQSWRCLMLRRSSWVISLCLQTQEDHPAVATSELWGWRIHETTDQSHTFGTHWRKAVEEPSVQVSPQLQNSSSCDHRASSCVNHV